MFAQHLYNALQTFIIYGLVGCGFYLSSVSCRHFNFGTALAFLSLPYTVWFSVRLNIWPAGVVAGFIVCGAFGVAWKMLSVFLFKHGSREGQLLVISLAILAIGENVLMLLFGNSSIALWPYAKGDIIDFVPVTIARQQIVLVLTGGGVLLGLLLFWRRAILGKAFRGLLESRLNLTLRGINVTLLETLGAAAGFGMIGLAGLLWGINARIRPTMALEVGVVGVVAFIVGPFLASGLGGLLWAALGIATLKIILSLTLEGDWNMTATLLLLMAVILLRKSGSVDIIQERRI